MTKSWRQWTFHRSYKLFGFIVYIAIWQCGFLGHNVRKYDVPVLFYALLSCKIMKKILQLMVLKTLFQESSQVLALIPRLIYSNNCYVAWNVSSGIIYFIKFAPCSFLIHTCIIGKCDWNYFTVNRKHENFAKKKVFQRNLGLNISNWLHSFFLKFGYTGELLL